ncbi:hypothetical protein NDU88_002803 [Pleurodeles waltl]|uniref:Uncharacterized protein n=1 Tax=Pleurodeles waltl TaxID=8319 RepID=A0AAV7VBL6_PLEWA|nr:hypothetical protein NDU88_002803 [Pleurodeles waltl]
MLARPHQSLPQDFVILLFQESLQSSGQQSDGGTAQWDIKDMLNLIPDEIRDLKVSQPTEVAALRQNLSKIEEAMENFLARLQETESRISHLEDQITVMQDLVNRVT